MSSAQALITNSIERLIDRHRSEEKPREMSRGFSFGESRLLNVRYWHLADIEEPTPNVRFRGLAGNLCRDAAYAGGVAGADQQD
jgi:hypothetical protein